MTSVPPFARNVRAGRPLNLDPDALAIHRAMLDLVERFASAETDAEAHAAMLAARALVPAHTRACRIIGF